MSRLAFATFGVFAQPSEHPSHASFNELAVAVFGELQAFDGFINSSVLLDGRLYFSNGEKDEAAWGAPANPIFTDPEHDIARLPTVLTLSLWQSIEAVRFFTYNGLHKSALMRRREWFLHPPRWPTYAMWWVADEVMPTYADASRRLEILHRRQASPVAFDFKTPFPPPDIAEAPTRARPAARSPSR